MSHYLHSADPIIPLFRCVILVCADRLVGIRNPLQVRGGWRRGRMPVLLTFVFLFTGGLTAYQHVEYFCLVRWRRNKDLFSSWPGIVSGTSTSEKETQSEKKLSTESIFFSLVTFFFYITRCFWEYLKKLLHENVL